MLGVWSICVLRYGCISRCQVPVCVCSCARVVCVCEREVCVCVRERERERAQIQNLIILQGLSVTTGPC